MYNVKIHLEVKINSRKLPGYSAGVLTIEFDFLNSILNYEIAKFEKLIH